MFYRRKILLGLLQIFDSELDKLSLQKLLMLFSKTQTKPDFDFVPYKFGCFSFQANADMSTMVKYGQVSENDKKWLKTDGEDYLSLLKENDKKALVKLKSLYSGKSKEDLIRYTYIEYPYYAINSTIAKKLLNANEYFAVESAKPSFVSTVLFTIGYEGIKLENYLNKLILNGVKLLCDVRKNSLSMKYGFSKSQLKNACEGVGIKYEHIPDLGIDSNRRQELKTQSDYDKLFKQYKRETLTSTHFQQEHILELLKKYNRIALTCFEANICQCHRKYLAEAVTLLPGFDYELKHI
ncbi:MAG: DUF488 domain-containing protein [Bacteroidales bacterium]|jgi:uncharacterized protein (DUF488 family)|nr:DUF488 domain-containing protein [Bacteroidales bacterium]